MNLFFFLFASITVLSAIAVISSRNPVHSVLFLILAFVNSAGLFVLAGAEFLAMILLIVYVGAVAVLFLFVVMMLNISLEEMKSKSENVIYLGHNGSPYSNRLIFHNYSVRDAIIKANMIYRNTSKYGLNNPSLSWLDDLEYEIKNVLKNKYYGAHTLLHFLPNLNQMEISINTNNSNSEAYKESTHFFDVEIDRKIKGIDYTISLNKNATALSCFFCFAISSKYLNACSILLMF